MEKKEFERSIIDYKYDDLAQVSVALITALYLKKGVEVHKYTFNNGIVPRNFHEGNWGNEIFLREALDHLATLKELDEFRIEDIIQTVRVYYQKYGDCFDVILNAYIEYHELRGKETYNMGNDLYLPTAGMTQVTSDMIGDCSNLSVYDPFGGFALVGNVQACKAYYGQEMSWQRWAIGVLRLEYYGVDTRQYRHERALKNWNPFQEQYDVVFADLVVDMDYNMYLYDRQVDMEDLTYSQSMQCLKNHGHLYLIGGLGTLGGEKNESRDKILAARHMKTMTMLPIHNRETFLTNAIAFDIVKSEEYDSIMVNGCGDFDYLRQYDVDIPQSIILQYDSIQNNSCTFLPNSYIIENVYTQLQNKGLPYKRFAELLCPAKSESIDHDYLGAAYVHANDFPNDVFICEIDVRKLTTVRPRKNTSKFSHPVLVSQNTYANRVAYIHASEKNPIYCDNDDLSVWELPTEVTVEYLSAYLKDEEFQSQIHAMYIFRTGLNHLVNAAYLYVPSLSEQEKFIKESMAKTLTNMGLKQAADAQRMHEEYKHNLRVQKHALGQEMLQIQSKINWLMKVLDKESLVDRKMKISPSTGASFEDYTQEIDAHMCTMNRLIETLSGDMKFERAVDIHLSDFFNEWCATHVSENNYTWEFQNRSVREEVVVTTEPLGEWYDDYRGFDTNYIRLEVFPVIHMPIDALTQIMRNITDNAAQYAFTDTVRNDYKMKVELLQDKGVATIRIVNNGSPLAASTDTALLLNYGYGHHTGIGLWQVKQIVEEYGLSVRVMDHKDAEYPFGIEMDFKDVSDTILKNMH